MNYKKKILKLHKQVKRRRNRCPGISIQQIEESLDEIVELMDED